MVAGVGNGTPYATATDAPDVMENAPVRSVRPANNTYKAKR